MENPLQKYRLFHTPKDFSQIQSFIDSLSPADKGIGWTIAAMTWNLASKTVDEHKEREFVNSFGEFVIISKSPLDNPEKG